MEHSRIIGGERPEPDAERLVVIVVFHQQHRCAADVMGEHRQGAVLLRAVFLLYQSVTGILLHRCFSFGFYFFAFIVSFFRVKHNKPKTAASRSREAAALSFNLRCR